MPVYILGYIKGIDAPFAASRFTDLFEIDWIWEALPEVFANGGRGHPGLMEYARLT